MRRMPFIDDKPAGEATANLEKIQINDTVYSVGGGGSEVIANNGEATTAELAQLKINGVNYSVPQELKTDIIVSTETTYTANTPTQVSMPNNDKYPNVFHIVVEYYNTGDFTSSWSGTNLVASSGTFHSGIFFKADDGSIAQCLFTIAGPNLVIYPVGKDMKVNKITVIY